MAVSNTGATCAWSCATRDTWRPVKSTLDSSSVKLPIVTYSMRVVLTGLLSPALAFRMGEAVTPGGALLKPLASTMPVDGFT